MILLFVLKQEFREAFSSVVHLLFCSCQGRHHVDRHRRRQPAQHPVNRAEGTPAAVSPTPLNGDGQLQGADGDQAAQTALTASERLPLQPYQRERRCASPVIGGSATAPAVVLNDDDDDDDEELADDALFEDLPPELRQEALSVLGHLRPQLPLGDRTAVPVVIQLHQRGGVGGGPGGYVVNNSSACAVEPDQISSYFSV